MKVVAALATAMSAWAVAPAAAQDASGAFSDDDGAYYEAPFDALAERGILTGTECAEGQICPGDPIKRSTMAVWLGRALTGSEPTDTGTSRFADVDADHWTAPHIERFAELGVTLGCATDPLRYCPDQDVVRAQMAAFLVRAFELDDVPSAGFTDTSGHHFETEIDKLAAARITVGCTAEPPRYCPNRHVTRGQMATFLARALGLTPPPEPQPATEPAISISDTHGCKLSADGQLACWGDNTHGQASPPPGTYTNIAVSTNYSCAIRSDGQLACWGNNTDGRTTPPAGQYTDVTANPTHPCGVRADGTIACWGESHTEYSGGSTDRPPSGTFADISLSQYVGCGIRTDQSIQCWGWTSGKLGIGPSPQGTFTAVDVTHRRACALRTDATITCWGNSAETLHDAPAGSHIDVSVSGGAVDGYSCALRTDLTITCWGEDTVTLSHRAGEQPTTIMGLTSPPTGRYQALALTNHHACALRDDNTHTCWGGPTPPFVETITVSLSPSILDVAEGGTSSYSISLSGEPAAPITIRIEVRPGSDLSVNRSSIVFDESNWRTGEIVAVTAAQDDDTESGFEGIDHTLTSTEPAYSSITVPALSVVVEDDGTDQGQTVMEPPGEVSGVRVTWNESAEDLTVSWHEPTHGGPVEGYAIDRASAGSAFPTISSASGLEFADYSGRYLLTKFPLSWSALVDHGDGSFSYTLDQDVPPCYGTPSRCRYLGVIGGVLAETAQVRVIAYNDAGFSVSPAIDVPTQGALDHRELQALTASWVQEYGARVSWLQEVWRYITTRIADPRPVVHPFDLQGFAFRDSQPLEGHASPGADCAHLESPDRICKAAGDGISDGRPFNLGTTIHELGHIYTMSNDAPSNPLAIAAGYLYLADLLSAEPLWNGGKGGHSGHPCNVLELFATAAADMVTLLASGIDVTSPTASRHSTFVWKLGDCDLHVAKSRWQQEIAVVWSALNGTVPQWYYDTFQMANGEWDLDALWSRMGLLPNAYRHRTDQSGQWRLRGPSYLNDFVIYFFKDEFGGYCSDSVLSFHQYILGGNPWRDGGCGSAETNTEQQEESSTEQQDPERASSALFEAVSAGSLHSCGLRTDGTVACWGDNSAGKADAPSGTFSAVSPGGYHSCGLRTDGTITCWGYNGTGQADAPSGTFSAVSAGGSHSCGLETDGTITCWGFNHFQQTSAPSGTFSAVSAGAYHSCGLRTDGTITCWGHNGAGQADAPSGTFSAVSAGTSNSSCGLRTDGTITCWGDNSAGQADAPSGTFNAVSAGGSHSCGLRTDGTITCWGDNSTGKADAPSGTFSAVSAGASHSSCGLRTDGTITCWIRVSGPNWKDEPENVSSASFSKRR